MLLMKDMILVLVELRNRSPYNTTSVGIIKGRENNENVKEVFQWLINDFSKYDKENFYQILF